MSDAPLARIGGRKFTFAWLSLMALCVMRAMSFIDGAQFMTGFLALGAGYFAVNYAAKVKASG